MCSLDGVKSKASPSKSQVGFNLKMTFSVVFNVVICVHFNVVVNVVVISVGPKGNGVGPNTFVF